MSIAIHAIKMQNFSSKNASGDHFVNASLNLTQRSAASLLGQAIGDALARRLPKHLSNLLRRCVSRSEENREQRIGACCCSEASAIMAPALCEVLPRRIETRVRQVLHVALFCRCRRTGPASNISGTCSPRHLTT